MYRLITRHTLEEKIMGLQEFKVKTANTVISADNSSLQSMATERIFDLFSLEADDEDKKREDGGGSASSGGGRRSIRALLEGEILFHAGPKFMAMSRFSKCISYLFFLPPRPGLPELWDEKEYEKEYDMDAYISKNNNAAASSGTATGKNKKKNKNNKPS